MDALGVSARCSHSACLCHGERVILGIWRSASGCVHLCVFTVLPSPLLGGPRWTLGLKPAIPNPKELKGSFPSPAEPERTLEEVISTVYQGPETRHSGHGLTAQPPSFRRKEPGKRLRMTLNTQQEAKTTLRRRASTPLPLSSRGHQPGRLCTAPPTQSQHPRLGQSASLNPPIRKPSPAQDGWSSESSDSEGSWEALYRVVLLGDPGVGKTSLASLFAGKQERELHEQLGGKSPVG